MCPIQASSTPMALFQCLRWSLTAGLTSLTLIKDGECVLGKGLDCDFQLCRPLKSMGTNFPRSIMFISESISLLALPQPESSGLSKLRIFYWVPFKRKKKTRSLVWWEIGHKLNPIEYSRSSENHYLLHQALYFTISQNLQQPWKVGDNFSIL